MKDRDWFTLTFLFLLLAISGCGQDLTGVRRSFLGEEQCKASAARDCECIQMNAPQHQRLTGVTVLKCPSHDNYAAAVGHDYCLNRDPSTNGFRAKLSLEGCPWKETQAETTRMLEPRLGSSQASELTGQAH